MKPLEFYDFSLESDAKEFGLISDPIEVTYGNLKAKIRKLKLLDTEISIPYRSILRVVTKDYNVMYDLDIPEYLAKPNEDLEQCEIIIINMDTMLITGGYCAELNVYGDFMNNKCNDFFIAIASDLRISIKNGKIEEYECDIKYRHVDEETQKSHITTLSNYII